MTHTAAMLDVHPSPLRDVEAAALARCIDECFACAQACIACADASLSGDSVSELAGSIAANLECADICLTTGRLLSRPSSRNAYLVTAVLLACRLACVSCGTQCASHGADHPHCQVCAEACLVCAEACQTVLAALEQ